MGKFSGAAGVRAAQSGNLAGLELPTGQQQPSLLQQLQEEQQQAVPQQAQIDQAPAGLQEGTDALIAEGEAQAAEAQRQAIPSIPERLADQDTVHRWLPQRESAGFSATPDGGLAARAEAMAENALVLPSVSTRNLGDAQKLQREGAPDTAIADAIQEQKPGDLGAALYRAGAVVSSPDGKGNTASPEFLAAGSMVMENFFADAAFGEDIGEGAEAFTLELEPDVTAPTTADPKKAEIKRSAQNSRLGEQIYTEYQRMVGKDPQPLGDKKQAETLATAFKDMWWQNNPTLMNRFKDGNGAYIYQLTESGVEALEKGKVDRARAFPTKNVQPAHQPPSKGKLAGDTGRNVVKNVLGAVGKTTFGKVIDEAQFNLSQIPNVVDKQRAKILYMTMLPVLAGQKDVQSMEAEINNMGPKQWAKFQAAEAEARNNPTEETANYSAATNMERLQVKYANELRSIAQNRKAANYFTYAKQAFNGRLSPQQTYFNATSSKAVRFVTRNPAPSTADTSNPNNRIHKNLRQMYAMMLVKGADLSLPNEREVKLKAAEGKLEAWGQILRQRVNAFTDEQYEAVSDAIEQGIPLDQFPELPSIDLTDVPELQQAIASKGEDGPHFMDGLIDFANYADARRAGRPYHSYFNAYIDGKTNGLAAAAMQVGSVKTAYTTGVLRNSTTDLLDEGDVRDALKSVAIASLDDGFGNVAKELATDFDTVARRTFGEKSLNKATTMTFGYGREAENFHEEIFNTMSELYATVENSVDPADVAFRSSMDNIQRDFKDGAKGASQVLLEKYIPALESVMSPEAIRVRSLMRGAAQLHAATNSLFSIKSHVGQDLHLGGLSPTGVAESTTDFTLFDRQAGKALKGTASHYESVGTAAAEKEAGSGAGSRAYGGAIPGPIQSLDASTVAMTLSGKSWQKLKAKSGGNPYSHTIYDAFKLDAMGYDTILEEVNKNWMDASLEWSALDEMHEASKKTMQEFNEKMSKIPSSAVMPDLDVAYMKWFTAKNEDGKLANFNARVKKIMKPATDKNAAAEQHLRAMKNSLRQVGYDVDSPPDKVTAIQLKTFVRELNNIMDLGNRMRTASTILDKKKKELAQEIRKSGFKASDGSMIPLQYYAH